MCNERKKNIVCVKVVGNVKWNAKFKTWFICRLFSPALAVPECCSGKLSVEISACCDLTPFYAADDLGTRTQMYSYLSALRVADFICKTT